MEEGEGFFGSGGGGRRQLRTKLRRRRRGGEKTHVQLTHSVFPHRRIGEREIIIILETRSVRFWEKRDTVG